MAFTEACGVGTLEKSLLAATLEEPRSTEVARVFPPFVPGRDRPSSDGHPARAMIVEIVPVMEAKIIINHNQGAEGRPPGVGDPAGSWIPIRIGIREIIGVRIRDIRGAIITRRFNKLRLNFGILINRRSIVRGWCGGRCLGTRRIAPKVVIFTATV